jgi:hypothetical protein
MAHQRNQLGCGGIWDVMHGLDRKRTRCEIAQSLRGMVAQAQRLCKASNGLAGDVTQFHESRALLRSVHL